MTDTYATRTSLAVALLALAFGACTPSGFIAQSPRGDERLPPDSTLAYTVFLIGDAGAPEDDSAVLRLLRERVEAAGEDAAVVFLGDNIYPDGLPPEDDPLRPIAQARIDRQIDAVRDLPARIVFVPGNHDWGGNGLGGNLAQLMRQERHIQAELGEGAFMPDRGFPGPADVILYDDLALVALDTQWWLQADKDYSDTDFYELEGEADFLIQLDDVLARHRAAGRRVVVVAHHPMYSNGSHGGRFVTYRRMPLVPFTRRFLGTPQDLSNFKYRRLIDGLTSVFAQTPGLVYAAGHEHNLQYFRNVEQHYIVSGSGSKSSPVASGSGASFVSPRYGFATLRYYDDGAVWLTFWSPGEDGRTGEPLYETRILGAPYVPSARTARVVPTRPDTAASTATNGADLDEAASQSTVPRPRVLPGDDSPYAFAAGDTVRTAIAPRYAARGWRTVLFGDHYRDAWAEEVSIPVLDVDRTAGGLTPIKKGGGLQTVSLRLQGADGDQYVLRSIDKRAERSLPPYLLETLAQDVVQDQNSAMFPYGAFIVPPIADAAGVAHTTPRLVIVPDSPRLGRYRDEFAGMVALFEIRPDEDQSDEDRLGNPPDIIGSPRMFEKTQEDNDFRVDERAYIRARLLDMLIGDWDRHKDQWRWAEYEPYEVDPTLEGDLRTQGKVYHPIPRDRDFAFFRFNGPLELLTRLTGNPHFRRLSEFDDEYGDIYGLNYNGGALDRQFTPSMTRSDWLAAARTLQQAVTDSVIEAAVRGLPPEIFALEGDTFIRNLRARRDALDEAAADYYDLLAREVDIVGSDKHERFEITRRADGSTDVAMIKTDKDGEIDRTLLRRTFLPGETSEIRLYGRSGNDAFVFTGEADDAIIVRAIGGPGRDVFLDETRIGGGRNRNLLYDDESENDFTVGSSARIHRTDDPAFNTYYPTRYAITEVAPVPGIGYNGDDGLFLGGGVRVRRHGWRKSPFDTQHTLVGSYALRTSSFNVAYEGIKTGIRGSWDGRLDAGVLAQSRLYNYFGLGNETEPSDEGRYHAGLMQFTAEPTLARRTGFFAELEIGPRFAYANVEPTDGLPENGAGQAFDADDLQDTYLVGARAAFNVDGTVTLAATQSGIRWLNAVDVNVGVRGDRDVFARLSSEVAYFYTLHRSLPLTLALRTGGATTVGDFPFYYAHTLGGDSNLRGYAKTRFAGRSVFFTNVEARLPVFDFNAYVTRGEVGVFGFFDTGRVWADDESSGVWHRGYGGGVWMTPFYQLAVTGSLGFSDEGRRLNVSLGFQF